MPTYRHVLLTTDFTDSGKKCLKKAQIIAEDYKAKLTVLHVVEPLPAYAMSYMGTLNLEEEMMNQAQISLESLMKDLTFSGADSLIELGSVKSSILKVAEEKSVDLIIVGSHGRHGLERLIGSTAAAVLQGAKCDVLVVHTYD
ncbi:MAG: universal stress protein [Legionellales bacterium]|nr:universal stress protein [Legionellales bacterium]